MDTLIHQRDTEYDKQEANETGVSQLSRPPIVVQSSRHGLIRGLVSELSARSIQLDCSQPGLEAGDHVSLCVVTRQQSTRRLMQARAIVEDVQDRHVQLLFIDEPFVVNDFVSSVRNMASLS